MSDQEWAAVRAQEKALVDRCVARDEDAWRELLRQYERFLQARIVKTLRCYGMEKTPDRVDDLVQDLFCKLLRKNCRHLAKFNPQRWTLAHFLSLRVSETVRDLSRLAKLRYCRQHAQPLPNLLTDRRDDLVRQEHELAEFVTTLPPEEAEVFREEYLGEPTLERSRRVSPITRWRRLNRARYRLRAFLNGE